MDASPSPSLLSAAGCCAAAAVAEGLAGRMRVGTSGATVAVEGCGCDVTVAAAIVPVDSVSDMVELEI